MRNNQCLCGFARFAYRASAAPACPKERDSCPNRPQTASKFGVPVHFCDFQNGQHRELLTIQSSANPGKTKTFANLCPNSFSQNPKDHLYFPLMYSDEEATAHTDGVLAASGKTVVVSRFQKPAETVFCRSART
jgi:hypothetical protein